MTEDEQNITDQAHYKSHVLIGKMFDRIHTLIKIQNRTTFMLFMIVSLNCIVTTMVLASVWWFHR